MRFDGLGDLSDAERHVASYITTHADEIAHMTIQEVAEATASSNATIIRLCHKMGLSGFRALRIALAQYSARRGAQAAGVDINEPFSLDAKATDVISAVRIVFEEAQSDTAEFLEVEQISRVAEHISLAKRIFINATGDTLLSCLSFANMLLKLNILAFDVNAIGEKHNVVTTMGKGDVLLDVSYSGKGLDTSLRNQAAAQGAYVLLMSATADALGAYDDYILLPPHESEAKKIATFYSQASIRFALNAIFALTYNLYQKMQL